jgi:triphosphoribosyl-dephospho-CoA synthase
VDDPSADVAGAFLAACLAELDAPKPGNVHRYGDGHGMTVADFERSAAAAAPSIAAAGAPVGGRVLGAVEATRAAVGQNTNLGIVLLCAPLAVAFERARAGAGGDLWSALGGVLAGLTVADARAAYRAIRLAAPGGLGRSAEADVAEGEPAVTLLEAMRLAAGRDRIARNYADGFRDLRETGVPTLERLSRRMDEPWAVAGVHLAFLAAIPDTHIARKRGPEAAERVRAGAAGLWARYASAPDPRALLPDLLALDGELKAAGLNPGTTADLAVATVFAGRLGRHLAVS